MMASYSFIKNIQILAPVKGSFQNFLGLKKSKLGTLRQGVSWGVCSSLGSFGVFGRNIVPKDWETS